MRTKINSIRPIASRMDKVTISYFNLFISLLTSVMTVNKTSLVVFGWDEPIQAEDKGEDEPEIEGAEGHWFVVSLEFRVSG